MNLITLLTDFGEKDGYAGVMKGVILSIAPQAVIVDLSHAIPPQAVRQAALVLGRSARYFPAGAIHVCVVDPGVGSSRRGLIGQVGGQFFIGPDNGLISVLYRRVHQEGGLIALYSLDNPDYRLNPVSHTFHGRDIFAPAAGHLAGGVALERFGERVLDPLLLAFPEPRRSAHGWQGEIVSIDAFGNLASNLDERHCARPEALIIRLKGHSIQGLSATFASSKPGQLAAILDSSGSLSICLVNGSAEKEMGARVGDPLELIEG